MSTRIDWRELLEEHRIAFIERGPNVRRGELNVRCPFCGNSDPSEHMGINVETGWWSCWRNRTQHSGKSPVRLLMRLLRVSYEVALQLAGLDASWVDPDGFAALAARLRQPAIPKPIVDVKIKGLPLGRFDALEPRGGTRRHWDYLENRGFDPDQLAEEYSVCCGVDTAWSGRVIFPYREEKRVVTWSGRAIGTAELRYKDLPHEPRYEGETCAIIPTKETLYNHDSLIDGGEWLVIVEGPIDALKIDCVGRLLGVRAVALSTASISDGQLARLDRYACNFRRAVVMMDTARELDIIDSMRMRSQLSGLGLDSRILPVPFGRKDAGELKLHEATEFCLNLRSGEYS